MRHRLWYRDARAWRFIAYRYLPVFALLSFAWEWAHVGLYTIWDDADLWYIAFAVLHCTVGDALIGAAAFAAALSLARQTRPDEWSDRRIAVLTVVFGAGYTMFSEWLHVTILRNWTYASSMPTLHWGSFEIGLTPVLQWLVIPPLALYLGRRMSFPRRER